MLCDASIVRRLEALYRYTSGGMDEHVPKYFTNAQPSLCPEAVVAISSWCYEAKDGATDLLARSKTCHLCKMLLSQLDLGQRTDTIQEYERIHTVRFEARRRYVPGPPWDEGKRITNISVFTRIFLSTGSTARLVLILYNRKSQVQKQRTTIMLNNRQMKNRRDLRVTSN
jgi:hypothetical protein